MPRRGGEVSKKRRSGHIIYLFFYFFLYLFFSFSLFLYKGVQGETFLSLSFLKSIKRGRKMPRREGWSFAEGRRL